MYGRLQRLEVTAVWVTLAHMGSDNSGKKGENVLWGVGCARCMLTRLHPCGQRASRHADWFLLLYIGRVEKQAAHRMCEKRRRARLLGEVRGFRQHVLYVLPFRLKLQENRINRKASIKEYNPYGGTYFNHTDLFSLSLTCRALPPCFVFRLFF